MVTFVMPNWQQTKMVVATKTDTVRATDASDIHIENVVSNLKQWDMLSKFPHYMARHVFVTRVKR